MHCGIYGVDGVFGNGKTVTSVSWIKNNSKYSNVIIFTNIKLKFKADNVFEYKSMVPTGEFDKKGNGIYKYGLLDVLQFIGKMDDYQRKKGIKRKDRIKFEIYEDEAGITYNAHNYDKYSSAEFEDYLLQIRKINTSLVLIAQKYKNIVKRLREHIDSVLYFQPFLDYFDSFGTVRQKYVDDEGVTLTYKYTARDEMGNLVVKEKPLDYHFQWLFKPIRYKFYDDLFLNKRFTDIKLVINYGKLPKYIKGTIDHIVDSYNLPSKKKEDVKINK